MAGGPVESSGEDQGGMGGALTMAPSGPPARRAQLPPDEPAWGGFHAMDLLVTAALRWRLLLLAALLPAFAGLGLAFTVSPRFPATAILLVQTARDASSAADITGIGPNVVSVEVLKVTRAEAEILSSPQVLRTALLSAPPGAIMAEQTTTEGTEFDRAVEELGEALRWELEPGSNLLRVTLTLPDRARALRGLEAILAAYFDRRALLAGDDGARLLATEHEQAMARIRSVDERIRATREGAGVLDIPQDIQLANTRREELMQRENRAREALATARAQLAAAEQQLSGQPPRVLAFSDTTNLRNNDDSRNQLNRLLAERAHMAAQYAPDWPGLRDLDRRIATQRALVMQEAGANFTTTREVRNPAQELLVNRAVTSRLEMETLAGQLTEVTRQREEAERRGQALLVAEVTLRDLQRERESLEAIARQLATREAALRLGEEARRQARAGVRLIQPPTVPVHGRSLKRVIAAGGVVLGLGLAAGLALLLTLTRRTAATVDEAVRALRLPALARFGTLAGGKADLSPDPRMEDLASLLGDARVDGLRPAAIQLVGAAKGDGRAELARALAVTLAQREGGRIALVDLLGDGREHLAALGSSPQVADRQPGEILMLPTVLPRLFVSFEAAESNLASPRASYERAALYMERMRRVFETIIIIAPDEPESYALRRVAAVVDANLLVVRGERTGMGHARRARDAVLEAGGALLGLAYTGFRQVLPRRLQGWS
ncbi:hypothetical protein KTR66_18410 [Roseococcus sp. SDR]|uniref:hypothetical protein n=1 Tax=Roseococcus sp. SDR TaxID=2835532 RepID=UPI001BCFD720|nr:hypothetical protein [Roseococcus sp. SDR]MBS7791979.1 hypothetical protein [Roseococcus sp. SDR]MBV1847293.1 hypothetical protein [Roseococcus sp. SDR]